MKIATKVRHQEHSEERGVTMILVAIAMVAIIAMAAMSIDLVTLYLAHQEAQRSADTAALAAARVISASGITGTAAPANNPAAWSLICGPVAVGSTNGWATQAATSVAAQNVVGGQAVNVTVTYSDGSTSGPDCSVLTATFAVNPMVTVQITPVSIPSFFSRIWGSTANSVSASATAEVLNPSNSSNEAVGNSGGLVTPVQPRCVKPWIVPNLDPKGGTCTSNCPHFVDPTSGSIVNHGISPDGSGSNGIIGEQFSLYADCSGANCLTRLDANPVANSSNIPTPLFPRTLEYLPGQVLSPAVAVPSCALGTNNYQTAVAGCDRSTVYQCGLAVPNSGTPNEVDLNENPGGPAGDTAMGIACTLTNSTTIPLDGQDTLRMGGYPLLPFAGDKNPVAASGTPLTNSNSVMSLPIYDGAPLVVAGNNTAPVTIVGFLQVFVNDVNTDGSLLVTVLNVAGCGANATTNAPVFSNSPVPIGLITPH